MNDAQREFLERVANSDHLIALGKVGSGSVAAALSDLAAKDRRIAELEAALGSEKETRVKYQDIVYAVCVRLEQMGAPRPLLITEVTTALAALLAQARREALEAAADVFAVDPYRPVERSLRRMAREVKP